VKRIGLIVILLTLAAGLSAGLELLLEDGSRVQLYSGYYALIIGNSDYQYFPKLRGVKQDVQDVKSMFEKLGIRTQLLENQTGDQMLDALHDFIDKGKEDTDQALIFYYAGHGYTEKRADGTDLGYIVPVDAPLYENNSSEFRKKSISMTTIDVYATLVLSKHVLMLFDSCFSGTLFTVRRAAPQIITEKTTQPVRQFITAGAANEAVPDESVFKSTLLKGLGEGFADLNDDGYVTGEELGSYLEANVVNYSSGRQHPKYGKINNGNLDRGDFVFALNLPVERKVVSPAKPTVSEPQPEVTELERLRGELRITADFETEVYIDRLPKGKVKPSYTKVIKGLSVGNHLVELFTDNTKLGELAYIRGGQTTKIDWTEKSIQSRIKKAARYTLNSDPQGANITIGGYEGYTGQTPFSFYDPEATRYEVTLSRPRHQNKTTSLTSSPSAKLESTERLDALFGNLSVTSEPTGCEVFINGKMQGKTPLQLSGEAKGLAPGSYTLELKHSDQNYIPTSRSIEIKANQNASEHFVLTELKAYISLKTDFYPAEVYLNSDPPITITQDTKLKARPGMNTVSVKPKAGSNLPYQEYNGSFVLSVDEIKPLDIDMIPEQGEIVIKTNQADAKFTLAPKDGGAGAKTIDVKDQAYPGTYTLAASKWGFYKHQSTVKIDEGKSHNISVDLTPIPQEFINRHKTWRINQYGSLATLALGIGASVLFYDSADSAYDSYQAETDPDKVLVYRNKYLANRRNYYIGLSLDLVSTAWFAWSTLNNLKATSRINTEMNSRINP